MAKTKSPIAGTVEDPTVDFTPVEIAGKTWKLAFTFHGLAKAEAASPGLNLMRGLAGLLSNELRIVDLCGMLFGALLLAHPTATGADGKPKPWTFESVCKLVQDAGVGAIPDIRDALLKSYIASMPEKKEDPLAAGAAAEGSVTASSGTDAGQSPASI
jgi:hypothetical protein